MARPRRSTPGPTASERAEAARARIIAAGGKRLQVMLSADGARDLAAARREGESDKAVLERALQALALQSAK